MLWKVICKTFSVCRKCTETNLRREVSRGVIHIEGANLNKYNLFFIHQTKEFTALRNFTTLQVSFKYDLHGVYDKIKSCSNLSLSTQK